MAKNKKTSKPKSRIITKKTAAKKKTIPKKTIAPKKTAKKKTVETVKRRTVKRKTSNDAKPAESLRESMTVLPTGTMGTLTATKAAKSADDDPTGSCRYADSFGQMQCESPVKKSYCDGKSGFFVPGGRC